MDVVEKIDLPDWVLSPETQELMRLIGGGGASPKSMFVGGCVRNLLMQSSTTDIDIATQYTPQEITKILEDHDVKVVPTGVDHGTVTAIINGQPFEITTLRKDVATDGRHAEVSFSESWEEDVRRRDFTMNTMLCDVAGNVYDPTGAGLSDIKQRRVVFVGDPATRIAEDYLRILRLFRFHAVYGEGEIDHDALKACEDAADKIKTLSRERITQEFLKILGTENVVEILNVMFRHNVLGEIKGESYNAYELKRLVGLQRKHKALCVMSRLFVVAGNQPKFYDELLRLSHAQKNFLVKLEMVATNNFFEDKKSLKKAIFYHGNDLLVHGYLLCIVMDKTVENADMFDLILNWQAPKCPIHGGLLIAEGYETGPELGQELARRQEEWLEEVLDQDIN